MRIQNNVWALIVAVSAAAGVLSAQTVAPNNVRPAEPITGGNFVSPITDANLNSNPARQQSLEGRLVDLQSYARQTALGTSAGAGAAASGISSSLDRAPLSNAPATPGASPTSGTVNSPNPNVGLSSSTLGDNGSTVGPPTNSGSNNVTSGSRVDTGTTGANNNLAPKGGTLMGSTDIPPANNPASAGAATPRAVVASNAGPVGIVSHGEVFVVLLAPGALEGYENQDVRLTGQVFDQCHAVLPSQLEIKQNGVYRNQAVIGLAPAAGIRVPVTAQDR